MIAALLGLALLGYAAPAVAQQKARLQTAVPSASIYFELLKRYADRVDKMSNGRIKIEVLPDGAIVPAFEILDAVDKGIVEGGYAWTHYWSGKHPAAGIFSNPMAGSGAGLDQLSHVAWLMEGGGNKLYERFYAEILKVNVQPLMIEPMGPIRWVVQAADQGRRRLQDHEDPSPPGITGEISRRWASRPSPCRRRDRARGNPAPSMWPSGSAPLTTEPRSPHGVEELLPAGSAPSTDIGEVCSIRPGGTSSRPTCRKSCAVPPWPP